MFLGMRGTDDWVANQRPENWRQQIMYLYPNGQAPLTAILAMMGSGKKLDDPKFHWWTQEQSAVVGDVASIWTDAACTVDYVGGTGVAGNIIYVVVTALVANRIKAGHQILLRDANDWRVDTVGKIISVTIGITAVLAVQLLEADVTTAAPAHDLDDCDSFKIIGNINPEGGEMPDAISLNPTEVWNVTQIFRSSLSITRTARLTSLRTGDDYQKAKRECLEMHSWEMELAFLWGIMTENVGDNGKPERTTRGLINFIRTYAPLNCDDFTLNAAYPGTWLADGEAWLKAYLEQIFRFGSSEKLCLCGSGFLLGIDALAQSAGQINLQPGAKAWGMDIHKWMTPFGSITMKTHPLFSYDATTRNMGIILEPKEIEYKYITDTTFYGESSAKAHPEGYGQRRIDGTNEEYLTECGLLFGLPQKCAVLNGVGLDS